MMYTEEFKESLVKKLLVDRYKSVYDLSKETGVPKSTIYEWKKKYSKTAEIGDAKMPKNWTTSEKVDAIVSSSNLTEQEYGKWLRENGLRSEHIESWKMELKNMKSAKPVKELTIAKRKIKELEKDLYKKDKALAEVSALLILKKKAELLWGEEEK